MTALSFTCIFDKPILNDELIAENKERIDAYKLALQKMKVENSEQKEQFQELIKENEEIVIENEELNDDKEQNNLVQLLITFGADIFYKDKLNRSPIHYAAAVGSQVSI